MFGELDERMQEYDSLISKATKRALAESLQENRTAIEYMLTTVAPMANWVDDQMTALTRIKEKDAEIAASDATAIYHSSRTIMLMLVLGSITFGLGIGVILTHSLTRQLGGEPAYAAA